MDADYSARHSAIFTQLAALMTDQLADRLAECLAEPNHFTSPYSLLSSQKLRSHTFANLPCIVQVKCSLTLASCSRRSDKLIEALIRDTKHFRRVRQHVQFAIHCAVTTAPSMLVASSGSASDDVRDHHKNMRSAERCNDGYNPTGNLRNSRQRRSSCQLEPLLNCTR